MRLLWDGPYSYPVTTTSGEIYHSEKAVKESIESSPYPCHLKGCDELFNTLEDRRSSYVASYKPKNCQETFYLEKNFDMIYGTITRRFQYVILLVVARSLRISYKVATTFQKIHYGQKYVCDVEGCNKVYTTAISLRGHRAQHEGFSKTCPYCGKTYKNPYGHKCKASRDNKKKNIPLGPNQTTRPQVTLPVNMLPVALQTVTLPVNMGPVALQTVSPPAPQPQSHIIQAQAPGAQQAVIMPQQLITHHMDIQQAALPIMGPTPIMPHTQVIPHSQPHSQVITHSQPHSQVIPVV
ncbi:hypothetical protein Btru_002619 [Bulinus truncatus]|nr:hypothetical protein Btru_002619 [Bulinus truncatus]